MGKSAPTAPVRAARVVDTNVAGLAVTINGPPLGTPGVWGVPTEPGVWGVPTEPGVWGVPTEPGVWGVPTEINASSRRV